MRKRRVRKLWRKRLSEVCNLIEGANLRDFGWILLIPLYRGDVRHAISLQAPFARKKTAKDIVAETTRFVAVAGYTVGVRAFF